MLIMKRRSLKFLIYLKCIGTDYLIGTYHDMHYTRSCSSNVLTECEKERMSKTALFLRKLLI